MGLTLFQQKLSEQEGHVIAVAPTGSGKTEGSILWAIRAQAYGWFENNISSTHHGYSK